jgi:type IV pilus assembly protein PilB
MNDNSSMNIPAVRFVNKMILDAVEANASEIQFDASGGGLMVAFVADGAVAEVARPPEELTARILNRVRVMAQVGIYGAGNPVEGEIKLRLSPDEVDRFRVTDSPNRLVIRNEGAT